MSEGKLSVLLDHPIALLFLALAAIAIWWFVIAGTKSADTSMTMAPPKDL